MLKVTATVTLDAGSTHVLNRIAGAAERIAMATEKMASLLGGQTEDPAALELTLGTPQPQ